MVRVNLLEPRGKVFPISSSRCLVTLMLRQRGSLWPSVCHLYIHGEAAARWNNFSMIKSWFSVKKVKTVVFYQEN